MRREIVDELLVEELFAGERPLLRRERLVFEGLQLRRDIALGVLQRLAPAIVDRNVVRVRARDLDIEAVHAVVFDLEVGDAAPRALPRFEVEQERAAVVLYRAQLVQLGIDAVRDDTTFAYHSRGLLAHEGELREDVVVGREHAGMRGEERAWAFAQERRELWQPRERIAQSRQITRPRGFKRDARSDALDVNAGFENGM